MSAYLHFCQAFDYRFCAGDNFILRKGRIETNRTLITIFCLFVFINFTLALLHGFYIIYKVRQIDMCFLYVKTSIRTMIFFASQHTQLSDNGTVLSDTNAQPMVYECERLKEMTSSCTCSALKASASMNKIVSQCNKHNYAN